MLILAAGEIYRETHTFRVRKYKVKTKKNIGIQNCVKVIFLSDLHNCVYGNKICWAQKKAVPYRKLLSL